MTSPRASERTLPCSRVMIAASSSRARVAAARGTRTGTRSRAGSSRCRASPTRPRAGRPARRGRPGVRGERHARDDLAGRRLGDLPEAARSGCRRPARRSSARASASRGRAHAHIEAPPTPTSTGTQCQRCAARFGHLPIQISGRSGCGVGPPPGSPRRPAHAGHASSAATTPVEASDGTRSHAVPASVPALSTCRHTSPYRDRRESMGVAPALRADPPARVEAQPQSADQRSRRRSPGRSTAAGSSSRRARARR